MGMNFSSEGYDGLKFGAFYVDKGASAEGPGWFIYGRNCEKYGRNAFGDGAYHMLCGYVREGTARHYNGKVRIGWRTKRAAQQALAAHLVSYPFLNSQGQ